MSSANSGEISHNLGTFAKRFSETEKAKAPKEEPKKEEPIKEEPKAIIKEEPKEEPKKETQKEEPKGEVKEESKKEEPNEGDKNAKPVINWDEAEIPDEVLERIAKSKGYSNTTTVAETQEEKDARERRENGEFVSWAIGEGKLKAEDLALPQTLQGMSNEELVRRDFDQKLLAKDKNMPKTTRDRLFAREYPLNAELPEDATAEQIIAFQEDKRDAQEKLEARANKLRNKLTAPIPQAKKEFENVKKNNLLIRKADEEFNTFAKSFKKDFVYKSEGGDIPIELTTDEHKSFLSQFQSIVRNQTLANPNGSLDVPKLAFDLLTIANRKKIDGVLYSRGLNAGKAEELKKFKNPITEPSTNAGAAVETEKQQKAEGTNKGSLQSIRKLGSLR
jgi:hypothetical protein